MTTQQIQLPKLIGTLEQIAWAERIRWKAMKRFELPADLLQCHYARVWIDRRGEWGIK